MNRARSTAGRSGRFGRYTVKQRPEPGRSVLPLSWIEYAYYLAMVISYLGDAVGLYTPLSLGTILLGLAALCVAQVGLRFFLPVAMPVCFATSFVLIQALVHGEAVMAGLNRQFISWILVIIIVYRLSFRNGFIDRFAVVSFLIALFALRYIRFYDAGFGVERATLTGIGVGGLLAGTNGIGEWFGFVALYFVIIGLETKRNVVRIAAWLLAAVSLYGVGLSVSRASLLATAVGCVIALRRLLRRGFMPLLIGVLLVWLAYQSGVFDQAIGFYENRATEETGRFVVWPFVLQRFLNSPLVGVGFSEVGTFVPVLGGLMPHNSFLMIALASGILPLALFAAYWWHSVRGALRLGAGQVSNAPLNIPLLAYAFLVCNTGGGTFMQPFVIVSMLMASRPGSLIRAGESGVSESADRRIARGDWRGARIAVRAGR